MRGFSSRGLYEVRNRVTRFEAGRRPWTAQGRVSVQKDWSRSAIVSGRGSVRPARDCRRQRASARARSRGAGLACSQRDGSRKAELSISPISCGQDPKSAAALAERKCESALRRRHHPRRARPRRTRPIALSPSAIKEIDPGSGIACGARSTRAGIRDPTYDTNPNCTASVPHALKVLP